MQVLGYFPNKLVLTVVHQIFVSVLLVKNKGLGFAVIIITGLSSIYTPMIQWISTGVVKIQRLLVRAVQGYNLVYAT